MLKYTDILFHNGKHRHMFAYAIVELSLVGIEFFIIVLCCLTVSQLKIQLMLKQE